MKPLKIKLRGAIGIKKGLLHMDEIEIDFSQFSQGLVAIIGDTGSGKSTILDNMQPYRQLVFRRGSLADHFFLKDSYRILTFEFDRKVYSAEIYIDGLTKASEAYLFEIINDTKKPLNDGKLSTYDKIVENIFGSPQLFFSSVFSGQMTFGFAKLSPGDRRKLFYELLNLNVYDQYLENAKSNLKQSEIKLAEIEGQINSIDVSEETKTELEEARTQALNGIANTEIEITKIETELDQINSAIRDAEIEIAKLEEKQNVNNEINLKRNSIKTKTSYLQIAHDKKLAKLNSDLEDTKKLISQNQKLIGRKEEIELNINGIQNLEINVQKAKDRKSEFLEKSAAIQKHFSDEMQLISQSSKEIEKNNKELAYLENQIDRNKRELENCQKQTSLINEVPCTEEIGTKCQFLKNAYESKNWISIHEENIKSLVKEYESLKEIILNESKKIDSKKQLINETYQLDSDHISINIGKINAEITEWEVTIKANSHYKQLADQLKTAEMEVKILTEKMTNISELISESKNLHEKQLEELSKESFELLAKYDSKLSEKIVECKDVLGLQVNKKEEADFNLTKQKTALESFKRNFQQTDLQIEDFKKNEEKISELNSRKSIVQNEIRDYSFLTKAFDKTGIPVLKLENSGIEITTIANELLSLFENKFRIVFETTKLKSDKKSYKESFDINIVEEDGVCEIANKSGGQQVWLETAIQSAISLVVRQQGRNIQTSFLDEKDGALDLENAYSYVEMIKKAHQMSGVHNTFIITHRTELLDFIPQQIKLADGLLSILN